MARTLRTKCLFKSKKQFEGAWQNAQNRFSTRFAVLLLVYLSFTLISVASDTQVEQHTNVSVCLWFIGEGVKG